MQKRRNVARFVRQLSSMKAMDNSPAIEVKNLLKIYSKRNHGAVRAVDGLSFEVQRGQIFGLLGPNGAGKTTTIKVLTTLLQPTGGTARVMGFDVLKDPLGVRKQICVVVQENAMELHLSVRNNFRVFGRFHGLSSQETQLRLERVCEQFGLREYLQEKGLDLSGGLKRRVQVAKTFLIDKPIVFLDEATTGMDTFNKRATIEAIKEETRKGRTIVLTTHVLDEAEDLCDTVAILNHGRLIAMGGIEEVKAVGLHLLSLTVTFAKVTAPILELIRTVQPVAVEVRNTTVEITLREDEEALSLLAVLRKQEGFLHFEITSTSLEDAFVQLLDNKTGS
jgi:ABC-2 type transport system ATP-binding protein